MPRRRFDTNNYEFNKDGPIGVYLIHGFSNTTYEIKELAEFLANNGFHTIANNLPGHGTNINECNKVKYKDWIDKVTQDVAMLASTSEKIYVIGNNSSEFYSYLNESIGNTNSLEAKYSLTVNLLKTESAQVIEKDATASKFSIKYEAEYSLFNQNQKCTIFNKSIKTNSSYSAKSAGYSFGTDISQNEANIQNIQKNIGQFISSLNQINNFDSCLN